jgi:CelD/BcsL family acetyltransferase involved in cellulose biosynthesis
LKSGAGKPSSPKTSDMLEVPPRQRERMIDVNTTDKRSNAKSGTAVEISETSAELSALAPEWRRLARMRVHRGLCTTYEWYRAWLDNVAPTATPFVISVRREGGELIGLAPFCKKPIQDLGFRLRAIGFGGREVVSGDYLDILALPESRAFVIDSVLAALAATDISLFSFEELVLGGDMHAAVERWAAAHGFGIRRQEFRICPFVALPADFESYLLSLSGSFRYHIKRRTRKLIIDEGFAVTVCSGESQLESALDTLIRLHLNRWAASRQPGTLGRPGMRQFLASLCKAAPEPGRVKLYLLSRGDEAIAALLTFWFGDTVYYYQAGWSGNTAVAKFSPGVVLMGRVIEDAVSGRMRYFDFLRGDEEYKRNWTQTAILTGTILAARDWISRAYLAAASLKDAVKVGIVQ